MDYFAKYIKYKNKYLIQKRSNKIKIMYGGAKRTKVDEVGVKCINLKNINVPKEYPPNSPMIKINEEIEKDKDKFSKTTEKFHPSNAQMDIDENIKEGKFNFTTKDGKYEVKAVPFMTHDMNEDKLYYPWVNSLHMNIKYFEHKIMELMLKYKKLVEKIDYMQFDCIENFKGDKVSDMYYDIMFVMKHLTDGIGVFEILFDNGIKEKLMITSIKKIE